jgi:hypothetical protein
MELPEVYFSYLTPQSTFCQAVGGRGGVRGDRVKKFIGLNVNHISCNAFLDTLDTGDIFQLQVFVVPFKMLYIHNVK